MRICTLTTLRLQTILMLPAPGAHTAAAAAAPEQHSSDMHDHHTDTGGAIGGDDDQSEESLHELAALLAIMGEWFCLRATAVCVSCSENASSGVGACVNVLAPHVMSADEAVEVSFEDCKCLCT